MKIAVIGGGITGLSLALKLADKANEVEIFEKDNFIGGLATYCDYNHFIWDKFYHVILPTDHQLITLIKDLGLENKLKWKQTYTGVYVDKKFYSVSNAKEFLLYPPLNLWQKFRLGLTILIGASINNSTKLEDKTTEEWLIKTGGVTTYEKFWKPLLIAKLGKAYKKVSAVFIWSYIKRLFSARSDADKKEAMGYVEGGYKTILTAFEKQLNEKNVTIHLQSSVSNIEPDSKEGISVSVNGTLKTFDKVIFTAPVPVLEKTVSKSLFKLDGKIQNVDYLGVICNVLLLKKEVTPFYVLNISDHQVPFTGVIGMSSLVDSKETGGFNLVYLPKYLEADDPFWGKSDEEIEQLFHQSFLTMYPDIKKTDIAGSFINRAKIVQPLQVKHYSSIAPKVNAIHPDFYVVNSSQILESTLNNNSMTTIVSNFLSQYGQEFKSDNNITQ